MELREFCAGAGLTGEAAAAVEGLTFANAEYDRLHALFLRDRRGFFREVNAQPDAPRRYLALYARFARDAHAAYTLLGISDEIYFDTFRDLALWCRTCEKKYGRAGIFEYDWLWRHIQLKLFRLGRLQFEPIGFDREWRSPDGEVRKNDVVLNVHVPEGEPLDAEACRRSFAQAQRFFRGIPPVFVCHSWLLGEELGGILRPGSNIAAFRKLFTLYGVDAASREAEERIFGAALENPEDYSEDTSLRQTAKAHLLAGGRLGSGLGIRFAGRGEL